MFVFQHFQDIQNFVPACGAILSNLPGQGDNQYIHEREVKVNYWYCSKPVKKYVIFTANRHFFFKFYYILKTRKSPYWNKNGEFVVMKKLFLMQTAGTSKMFCKEKRVHAIAVKIYLLFFTEISFHLTTTYNINLFPTPLFAYAQLYQLRDVRRHVAI